MREGMVFLLVMYWKPALWRGHVVRTIKPCCLSVKRVSPVRSMKASWVCLSWCTQSWWWWWGNTAVSPGVSRAGGGRHWEWEVPSGDPSPDARFLLPGWSSPSLKPALPASAAGPAEGAAGPIGALSPGEGTGPGPSAPRGHSDQVSLSPVPSRGVAPKVPEQPLPPGQSLRWTWGETKIRQQNKKETKHRLTGGQYALWHAAVLRLSPDTGQWAEPPTSQAVTVNAESTWGVCVLCWHYGSFRRT